MDALIAGVITKAVSDAERYPFLFVGSGLSRRYADSPTWVGLLQGMCEAVLGDRYAFARYRAQARSAVQNGLATSELPYAATLMEDEVNAALLGSEAFAGFRARHDADLVGGASPMKTYVADLFSSLAVIPNGETDLLARVGADKISGVVTTNYDRVCEELFPSYNVYVGQGDLVFSEPSFAQEIYKIHGSVSDPDGMVLTEADYAEFGLRRKYLSAKLLTIFAEYPVIFLGYSITDENIRAILSDVCECVPKDRLGRLRDRMIFVEWGRDTRASDHTMDLGGNLLPMTRVVTDDFASVYEGLLGTRKLYSPRLIRELKGNVFRLAERVDPRSEIVTAGFDSVLERLEPGQRIAIQIAVSPVAIGKPISAEDIFQDVVLDDLGMDHRFIVDNYLNTHVRRLAGGVPFYKYIVDLGDDVGKAIAKQRKRFSTLDCFRTSSIHKHMEAKRLKYAGHTSVDGLARACEPDAPYALIPFLHDDEIDVDQLGLLLKRGLLSTEEGSEERRCLLKDSDFRKCVRMYDFLRYFGR